MASHFHFVVPKPYLLSAQDAASKYHYISAIDTLKAVLSRNDINDQVNKNHHARHHPDILYETCNGEHHKTNEIFSSPIYIDEFEICNPIGAKRDKYKLTGVYYQIGNLPTKYHSLQIKFFSVYW